MFLIQWVPEKYRAYFPNLTHGARENDFPDSVRRNGYDSEKNFILRTIDYKIMFWTFLGFVLYIINSLMYMLHFLLFEANNPYLYRKVMFRSLKVTAM